LVLNNTDAGLIFNPTRFFLTGMKLLYPCTQTGVPIIDIYVYICVPEGLWHPRVAGIGTILYP
jgi:hypothetical protein